MFGAHDQRGRPIIHNHGRRRETDAIPSPYRRSIVDTDRPIYAPKLPSIGKFLGDYRLHWILMSPEQHCPARLLPGIVIRPFADRDRAGIIHDTDADFAAVVGHLDSGATGHVLEFSGEIASIVHYLERPREADDTTWPLRRNEVALVHIATRSGFRRLGFATTLIAHTMPVILASGADAALCRVWWNHQPLLRAFRHAGWHKIGFAIEWTRSDGHIVRFHIPLAPRRRHRRRP